MKKSLLKDIKETHPTNYNEFICEYLFGLYNFLPNNLRANIIDELESVVDTISKQLGMGNTRNIYLLQDCRKKHIFPETV